MQVSRVPLKQILIPITAFALGVTVLATVSSAVAQSTFKVLYAFKGGSDGANPNGGLTLGARGGLYGTTPYGGSAANSGTVFYVDSTGKESVIYRFTGGTDGGNPYSALIRLGSVLYGTTSVGGAFGSGSVFRIDTTGKETVIHSFAGFPTDGSGPYYTTLIHDPLGNLYGTTAYGGTNDAGTVFRISPTGAETILYSFTGGVDGQHPFCGLAQDAMGNLYGTTDSGGAQNFGTVFKISPMGKETVLYSFNGYFTHDGAYPHGRLIRDRAGNLYGTTQADGTSGEGDLFKVSPAGVETVLYNFGLTGGPVYSGVLPDGAGNFYGTAANGGSANNGTVFKIDPTDTATILYDFTGQEDGGSPEAGVVRDAAGNLSGVTSYNGAYGFGTVFELTFP